MNLEWFIARRLLGEKQFRSVSVPIVKIAVAGIALGVCVMLLSVFVTSGFKEEITAKLSGFTAHIDLVPCEDNLDFAGEGMELPQMLIEKIRMSEEVRQFYPYVLKPSILKSEDEIHGLLLKGLDSTYQAGFFEHHLVDGRFPELDGRQPSGDILISSSVASLLDVGIGDRLTAHFVQQPPRMRKFTVCGIFDTGFKEYDDMAAVCDMRLLQRLNGWGSAVCSGWGIELGDLGGLDAFRQRVADMLPLEGNGDFYRVRSLKELAPQIFDWLDLLDMNVVVILVLIMTVAGFNMVSGLLILILDKTSLIGILKALGYRNVSLRRLFLYVAAGLIARGMLVGNILALVLGGIQYFFRPLSLDAGSYYMDSVPVSIEILPVILLNAGVMAVSVLMLVVPAMLVSSIRPIRAIRFD